MRNCAAGGSDPDWSLAGSSKPFARRALLEARLRPKFPSVALTGAANHNFGREGRHSLKCASSNYLTVRLVSMQFEIIPSNFAMGRIV